jgi:isopentenyldiphosphate isomerase
MLDQEETLLVVDENNKPLAPKPRAEVHKQALWHRAIHVWIINSKAKVLCQRRSLQKDVNSGMLCPFLGGHVGASETEIKTAVTELKEELGLEVKADDLKMYKIYRNQREWPTKHFQYLYIYFLRWDGSLDMLKPEPKEVDSIMWKDKTEVFKNCYQLKNSDWTRVEYLPEFLRWVKNMKAAA